MRRTCHHGSDGGFEVVGRRDDDDAVLARLRPRQERPDAEQGPERAVTDALPNVSAIRVRDALDTANEVLTNIDLAVTATYESLGKVDLERSSAVVNASVNVVKTLISSWE